MMLTVHLLSQLPFHGFRLGPMRLTAYGACAAVGVVLAMGLSGRAARRVGLHPEAAWDAGLFAVMSCFFASRLLLVLSDPKAFARYPLLVLSLPSLTIAGIAVAGVATWIYLRRKQLPVFRMLDAFAPCGATLAAFLELGHWVDGSEPGMPLSRVGHEQTIRFLPVSMYGVALSAVLACVLWIALTKKLTAGRVAALGMMLGGGAAFALDMVSLPLEIASTLPLEPGQFVSLGAMLAGALLWFFAGEVTADNTSLPAAL